MDDAEVPISVVSVGLTVLCTLNRIASEIVRVSVSLGDGPHTAARKRDLPVREVLVYQI